LVLPFALVAIDILLLLLLLLCWGKGGENN
jgi:hypothetical protein